MKSKNIALVLTLTMAISTALPVFAKAASPSDEKKDYTLTVDGTAIQNPIYENKDHAHMFPLREVSELLGFSVTWNDEANSATVSLGDKTATAIIGEDFYTVSGNNPVQLGAKTDLTNGLTYVSSLFFSQFFDVTITNEPNSEIIISRQHTVEGAIKDATMNTLIITTEDGKELTFSTVDADKTYCNGLTIGSDVVVFYTGTLENCNVVKLVQPKS